VKKFAKSGLPSAKVALPSANRAPVVSQAREKSVIGFHFLNN